MAFFEAVACKKCQIMGKYKNEKDRSECGQLCVELETLKFQCLNSARKKQFGRCALGEENAWKYVGKNTRRARLFTRFGM